MTAQVTGAAAATQMYKEISQQPMLMKTLLSAQDEVYADIAREYKKRKIKSVVFAARGSSDHAAVFGQYLFSVYCSAVAGLAVPSAITCYGAAPDYSKSLVIGISQSGEAADVLEVIRTARVCGGLTVAITNEPASPLASAADFTLLLQTEREISVAATKTFMAQMFCLARLAAAVSKDASLKKQLRAVPSALSKNFAALEKEAAARAARCRFIRDGFVFGRGFSLAVALETALKIKETNYIKMQAAASSDFMHGPIAQIAEDDFSVLFALRGPTFADTAALGGKLCELGAELLVVTDDEDFCKKSGGVRVRAEGEVCSAFVCVLFAQLFAERLAAARGKNPDSPRTISKVTVTR